MRLNRQRHCVMVASLLVMFFSSGLSWARDTDSVLRNRLMLPELIHEVLARNPELVAARKQWEAATNRIVQARSLDDPILSVQLWNVPQTFNVTQTQNNIFGLSQNLPFPGKRALKGDVASRSADMTEQAVRAKERELVARLKQAYYDLFLAQKAVQIHHEQVELLRQFVEIANAKFRAGKGSQADVLKAQVELSLLFQHRPVLEQRRETAEAMLNTLLDRDTASPLGIAQEPSQLPLRAARRRSASSRVERQAGDQSRRAGCTAERAVPRAGPAPVLPGLQRGVSALPELSGQRRIRRLRGDEHPVRVLDQAEVRRGCAGGSGGGRGRAGAATYRRKHDSVSDQRPPGQAQRRSTRWPRCTAPPSCHRPNRVWRRRASGYRSGKAGFLDLIEAQRAWRGFQLEYFKALVDRQHRLAELEQVVGITLDRQS